MGKRRINRYLKIFTSFPPSLEDEVIREINWACRLLKKDDRIVWYLKARQVAYFAKIPTSTLNPEIRKKVAKCLRQKGGADNVTTHDQLDEFKVEFEHFTGVVESNERPDFLKKLDFWKKRGDGKMEALHCGTLLERMKEAEEQMQQLVKDEIPDLDGQPWLEINENWCWFLVEEGRSGREGKAMNHCGNQVGYKRGDKLLSLREKCAKGEVEYWKPHLTFIMCRGVLGEMKGYANSKPDKKYHPFIMELLLHPDVKELGGGGYLESNNFSLYDLSKNDLKELIERKPLFFMNTSNYEFCEMLGFCDLLVKVWNLNMNIDCKYLGSGIISLLQFDNMVDYVYFFRDYTSYKVLKGDVPQKGCFQESEICNYYRSLDFGLLGIRMQEVFEGGKTSYHIVMEEEAVDFFFEYICPDNISNSVELGDRLICCMEYIKYSRCARMAA
jgi:hypothetical protein